MRASGISFTLVLLLFAATAANAAPPAAPQVTMGADIKLLRFDWEPVTGASFYRLWVNSGGPRYITVGERIPASITQVELSIAVHLREWERTRYVVTACNSDGCTSSRALNPRSLMLDTIGYLKASNTDVDDVFGQGVVLSGDGYTLAVTAPREDSNASGVDGDQSDNSSTSSGAVYVFRRRGNTWQQEAYLKAGVNRPEQDFGTDPFLALHGAALSADGSMLAVSASHQDLRGIPEVGAVYVFRRTRNAWSLMATLRSPEPEFEDLFGMSPDFSDDGRTLKVTSRQPINPANNSEMRTHVFVLSGNTWQHSATLAPFYPGDRCHSTRLSGDGQTLVMSCEQRRIVTMKRAGDAWVHASDLPTNFYQIRQPIALNPDATVMALRESGNTPAVHIYRWVSGAWLHEDRIVEPTPHDPFSGASTWGWDLALGDEGKLLAIGDFVAREDGAGISPALMPGTESRGAVYLYRNDGAGTWSLHSVVKSPNPGIGDTFAGSISLSASGRTLAVGAPGEDSSATGIDGDRANESADAAGAAYLY